MESAEASGVEPPVVSFPDSFVGGKDAHNTVEMLAESPPGGAAGASHVNRDWYQTESHVVVTVMAKNVPKDGVSVHFLDKEATANIQLASGEILELRLLLLHAIIPQQSSFRVLSTKVELKMKKADAIRWQQLEGRGQEAGADADADADATQKSGACKWDKMATDISEEEKNEKLEGDAALNRLFQQIYSGGTDEVKRAMNKSFMESGGTVLSTDWQDVGSRKVEVNPPDGMELKKY